MPFAIFFGSQNDETKIEGGNNLWYLGRKSIYVGAMQNNLLVKHFPQLLSNQNPKIMHSARTNKP